MAEACASLAQADTFLGHAADRIGELLAAGSASSHGQLVVGATRGGELPDGGKEVLTREGDDEDMSDVDDEELDAYLLDEEERAHKSDIWHEVNKDYLEEWHMRGAEAKRKKEQQKASAADSASEAGASSSKRSRRSSLRSAIGPCSSATQSTAMALARKAKIGPSRINIEALESLFS